MVLHLLLKSWKLLFPNFLPDRIFFMKKTIILLSLSFFAVLLCDGSDCKEIFRAFNDKNYSLTVNLINQSLISEKKEYLQYLKAVALKKDRKYDDALLTLNSLSLKQLEDNILYHKADIFKNTGNSGKYIETLSHIVENHKNSRYFDQSRYFLAHQYLKSGKSGTALNLLKAIWQDKYSDYSREAGYTLLSTWLDMNNGKEFNKYIYSYLEKNKSDDFSLKLITALSARKNFEPESLKYKRLKLEILYKNRLFDEVIEEAKIVTSLETSDTMMDSHNYKWARSLSNLGKLQEALDKFATLNKTASTDNWKARATYQMSSIYIKRGKEDTAFNLLGDTINKYPQSPAASDCLFRQIRLAQKNNNQKQAVELSLKFVKNYQTSSDWNKVCLNLGFIYLEEKKADQALALFAKVAGSLKTWVPASGRAWRDREEAFFWKASTLERLSRKEEAWLIYDELVRKNPRGFYSLIIQKNKAVNTDLTEITEIINEKNLTGIEREKEIKKYESFYRYPVSERKRVLALLREYYNLIPERQNLLNLKVLPVPSLSELSEESSKSDILLALHLFDEGADEYKREHKKPDVQECINLSHYYSLGNNYYESIKYAGMTASKYPDGFPFQLYPEKLKNLLYPLYYNDIITERAAKEQIPPLLIASVIREESHFDASIKSWAAARGLMQFIPSTADHIAKELGMKIKTDDLYNPEISISLGARYLRNLLNEFNSAYYAVASYNGGEGAVRRWLKNCKTRDPHEFIMNINYSQTRNYVRKVMASYFNYIELYGEEIVNRAGS